jgi:putative flippase GtrA
MSPVRAELVRYVGAGALNTALTYLVLLLALRWLHYGAAYTVAYVTGILLAYALQTRFVFRVRGRWRTAMQFPLIYLLQYVLGLLVLGTLLESTALPPRWAALVTVAVTVPAGFVLSRLLLAGRRHHAGDAAAVPGRNRLP